MKASAEKRGNGAAKEGSTRPAESNVRDKEEPTKTTKEEVTNKLKAILEEISRGEGAYSMSQLVHAENCIENMKELAKEGLKLLREFEK